MGAEAKSTGLMRLQGLLNNRTMQNKFELVLKENAPAFMASIIELYQTDTSLQECNPDKVVLEALKAATLKLPINKQLGFAYIVPYKSKGVMLPQFQLGYKGYIQLAQRTGQYKHINADAVFEGERVEYDRITGMLCLSGEAKSNRPIGYFAYFQLMNGFEKCVYWTRERVIEHAQRYSKSWSKENSPWRTNFDAMALKTVLRNLISKYGIMSIEFAGAVARDLDDAEREAGENANGAPIRLPETPEDEQGETPASPALSAPAGDEPGQTDNAPASGAKGSGPCPPEAQSDGQPASGAKAPATDALFGDGSGPCPPPEADF